MSRKTLEVGKIIYRVNNYLANPNSTPDGREAMIAMLEGVLFDTGNYQGFKYLDLKLDEDGNVETLGCGSRRYYFVSSKILEDYEKEEDQSTVLSL